MKAEIKHTTRDFGKGQLFEVTEVVHGGVGGGKVYCVRNGKEIVLLLDEVNIIE